MKNLDRILTGDEGMWLVNALPTERIRQLYGFIPPDGWLEHVQKASVRVPQGSASFVSGRGLLVTNHHVAEGILHNLSKAESDYLKNGFYAVREEDEIKAPGTEVLVLWEIEDVTAKVQAAVKPGMSQAKAFASRRAEIAKIESESHKATGLQSNVITFYQGGRYHLYRYKKYTDIRVVFAPEKTIANFGDDVNNYEYPRYSLDAAFLRVYENGQPLETPYFFKWSSENPSDGDLLFVAGHPGNTDRLSTVDRIKFMRDTGLPKQLTHLYRREICLQQFSGRSPENTRRAESDLRGVQNYRKRVKAFLDGLQNPEFVREIEHREKELQRMISKDKKLKKTYGGAWEQIKLAEKNLIKIREKYNLLEGAQAFNCRLFGIARTILRLLDEDKKPNEKRLPEYRDSNRGSLLNGLFSPAPIYKDLEEHLLADSFSFLLEAWGPDNSIVKKVLEKKSPKDRARELISQSVLDDVEKRKNFYLYNDPFIRLAAAVDKESRAARKYFEENVEELRRQAYAKIAEAKFTIYGENLYPDATFTLRIAYGKVKGYEENGVALPAFTTIGGVFKHADSHLNQGAWKLPSSWETKRSDLEPNGAAFNFVTTHDTHGGNSGSPVIDKDLRITGLLFDGNIHKPKSHFLYTGGIGRSISVHSAGILEALKTVYGLDGLVKELTGY